MSATNSKKLLCMQVTYEYNDKELLNLVYRKNKVMFLQWLAINVVDLRAPL